MAEQNCLAGCVGNYVCGQPDFPGPAGQQAEAFAPWCWVSFGAGKNKITVGNESYESDPNTACIKSLEIGWVNTPSMKCEIIDEKGGTLAPVADAVRKCIKNGTKNAEGIGTTCTFQFGWIMTTCEGGQSKSHVIPSDIFKVTILKLEVNYSEGKIKYTFEAGALSDVEENARKDVNKGEDSKPVDIEAAIRSLCSEDPSINVRFAEITPDGKLKDVKFEWARVDKSPKASWQSDNMNRISVITKWLSAFRVKDGKCDKGLLLYFSPEKHNELIVLKDPMPAPGESRSCVGGGLEGANNTGKYGPLGTFIVNGGKCSTVIEFTPKMNIVNAIGGSVGSGGDTSGPNKSSSQYAENERCENLKKMGPEAGTQLQATITQQAFDAYGTKSANEQALKSETAHHRASVVTSVQTPGTEATIRILGNPSPRFCGIGAARNMSIVVINPFHIRGSNKCGDWLAYPGCNELFTNRLWMCRGINHSIQVGSYTTTIDAFLASPNIQLSSLEPLGGEGSGGPTIQNGCG